MKPILYKNIALLISLLFCLAAPLHSQEDARYAHFYENRMFYNPAGMTGDNLFRLSFTDREQWWGSEMKNTRPSYRLLSASQFLPRYNMGVGLSVSQWNHNVVNNLSVKASYSYHLQIDHFNFLSFGVNVGFFDNFVSGSVLPNGDYGVEIDKYVDQNMNIDLGLGIEYYNNEITAGVSVQHLPIKIGDNPAIMELHSYYYLSYDFELRMNWNLMPLLVLRQAGRTIDVDIGLRTYWKDIIYFGGTYSINEISFMAGVSLGKNFSIGYACDVNIGPLKSYKPSHEFMLIFKGDWVEKRKSRSYLRY